MENNKSFFKHSKNAGAFVKQFDDNIAKATEQIAKAEQELKLLKSVKSWAWMGYSVGSTI